LSYQVRHIQEPWAQAWDSFVERAEGGTLFHRLDFLAYHGRRFADREHHLVFLKGETLMGVMPLALFPQNDGLAARSPYGGSYGGPVFLHPPTYHQSHELVEALLAYLGQVGVNRLTMTLPIHAAYRQPCDTFRLVLLERGFTLLQRDISSVVPLGEGFSLETSMVPQARNKARKASKEGVEVIQGAGLEDFWEVLALNFAKHGRPPTHTREDLAWLMDRLPQRIYLDVAVHQGRPVAGLAYFVITKKMNSSFYLCQDPDRQHLQGLTLLVQEALARSHDAGYAWFDFGTSSVGMQGRPGVFAFKENFGAVGLFRETYTWQG
jgi:hypothetical protein